MKTILIAEDDQFYIDVYKFKLTKEGYEIIIARDGEETLKTLQNKKPDLIILDLVMPIKDGFEVLKELKSNPNYQDIKVVVVSNLGQEKEIEKAMQLGATDYFIKANLTIQQMVEKINGYLK